MSVPVAAGCSFAPAFLCRKFQLEIHILIPGIIQDHYRVIGFPRFFAVKPGHGNAALFQKGRCHRLCYGFFLAGKEFIVFPQRKGTVPVITKESLFALIYRGAAAGQTPTASCAFPFASGNREAKRSSGAVCSFTGARLISAIPSMNDSAESSPRSTCFSLDSHSAVRIGDLMLSGSTKQSGLCLSPWG